MNIKLKLKENKGKILILIKSKIIQINWKKLKKN